MATKESREVVASGLLAVAITKQPGSAVSTYKEKETRDRTNRLSGEERL
jgi:hypothetical protein